MGSIIIHYSKKLNIREYILLKTFEFLNPLHAVIHHKRQPWGKTVNDLKNFPGATLGNELGNFLDANHLEPVAKAEKHDAYHVLLDYGTDIKEEAGMQWFLMGNGKRSPFTMGTSLLAAFVLPERLKYFMQQFRRGLKSKSISNWDFNVLLEENYKEVKGVIFKQPVTNDSLMNKIKQFDAK